MKSLNDQALHVILDQVCTTDEKKYSVIRHLFSDVDNLKVCSDLVNLAEMKLKKVKKIDLTFFLTVNSN